MTTATHSEKPSALITGGSRGIGAAISLELAQQGYYVYINYNSNENKAQEVLKQIHEAEGEGELCGFDVSNSVQVDEKFAQIAKTRGPLRVLVNNAGVNVDSLLIRMKDEDLEKILSINLKGAIYCTRAASKQMMRERQGSIIQISSVVGECGSAGQSAYVAAKAGLIGFSKSVAKELASRNVRVNTITPGYITTDMTGALTDSQKEAILREIPLGIFGAPEDISSLVAFLASPKSRYMTGQVIGVNGGIYM
jgi:3-oxoacyl-[acyl-carrier protein] reductase